MKNSFLQLGIVSGFIGLFNTDKTSYGKNAMPRLMNNINYLIFLKIKSM